MPLFELHSLPTARIHLREQVHPAVAFAASELQRYLQAMAGIDVAIANTATIGGRTTLILGLSPVAGPMPRLPERSSYVVRPTARQVAVYGGSPRALLQGVYALLEGMGCEWSLHGPDDEHVPDLRRQAFLDLDEISHTPSFRLHGYCSDIMTWHYTQAEQFEQRLPDDRRMIDWMGKSGATTFFFIRHPFDTQLKIPELADEFVRRGIDVEYGGHVMPILLPRELFAAHPEFFPETDAGQRSELGNLCSSNAEALSIAASNALAYVRDNPEMSALHIWGADLWQGGWCRCAACKPLSVQDQSLRVCNAVADRLRAEGLPQSVCYLAYHDTLDAELTIEPAPNVVCEWAPRERCYGHAIDDPECERNGRYRRSLEGYLERFAGRVRLFEYYGDTILYFGCAVPLAGIVLRDMEYYHRLGIRQALMLQFGTYSTWAHPLSYFAFSAASMGTAADGDALRRSYCRRFGPEADLADEVLAATEAWMSSVVRYGDVRLPPRNVAAKARVRDSIVAALPELEQLAQRLAATSEEELDAHARLLRYNATALRGVLAEIVETHSGGELFDEALELVAGLDRRFKGLWGEIDLPIIHSFYSAAAHLGMADDEMSG